MKRVSKHILNHITAFLLMAVLICQAAVVPAPARAETGDDEEDAKLIVIDAGHQTHAMSDTEPIGPGASERKAKVTGGASGCVTHLPEYKLNLQVSKKLKKELESRGYEVIMVRTKNNVKMSNAQRAKVANKNNADAFIRIHANSSDSSSVTGALTIAQLPDHDQVIFFLKEKYQKEPEIVEKGAVGDVRRDGREKPGRHVHQYDERH